MPSVTIRSNVTPEFWEMMKRIGEEQTRFLKRAVEMGAHVVHDSIYFDGTLEQQRAQARELFASLSLPVPKDLT